MGIQFVRRRDTIGRSSASSLMRRNLANVCRHFASLNRCKVSVSPGTAGAARNAMIDAASRADQTIRAGARPPLLPQRQAMFHTTPSPVGLAAEARCRQRFDLAAPPQIAAAHFAQIPAQQRQRHRMAVELPRRRLHFGVLADYAQRAQQLSPSFRRKLVEVGAQCCAS